MLGRKELNSSPITLAQVKEILSKRATEPDFGYEQQTCLDYSNQFCKLKPSDASELFSSLKNIEGMTDDCAIKIVDMLPQLKSTVQVILAKDKVVLDDSKLTQVIELVSKASANRISPPPKIKEEEQPADLQPDAQSANTSD